MSFAFGFDSDDIEHDSGNDDLAQQVENCTIDNMRLMSPRKHTLQELLSSIPSQISYNLLPISRPQNNRVRKQSNDDKSGSQSIIPRRSLFDIRTQLMAEANPEENDNDSLLAGLERGDLTSGIYEGGFKTWECSLDLASLVADLTFDNSLHIIELGAGSAVPSLLALNMAMKMPSCPATHFTLCDYNTDVLRLTTAPNVFLAAEMSRSSGVAPDAQDHLDVEDVDEQMVGSCIEHLEARNLSFDFISGAWGEDFLRLVRDSNQHSSKPRKVLVLASETIYSPKSTKVFADTLMHLLRRDVANSKAWIAAKKVYFGVGGGVDDFVNQIRKQRGSIRTLLDIKEAGVGRVVLEIVSEA